MPTKIQQKGDYPAHTTDFVASDADQVRFYDNPMTDNIVTAILALSMETWSNRRRTLVLERLLEEKGVSRDMVEGYMPTDGDVAEWEIERDRFVERVMGSLMRQGNLPPSAKRDDQ
jgi:hypothetical protein